MTSHLSVNNLIIGIKSFPNFITCTDGKERILLLQNKVNLSSKYVYKFLSIHVSRHSLKIHFPLISTIESQNRFDDLFIKVRGKNIDSQ